MNNVQTATLLRSPHGFCALFIHLQQTLYCSLIDYHQVIAYSLNRTRIIATKSRFGRGSCGKSATQLCQPSGIFVHEDLDVYVADTGNSRIQIFRNHNSQGETFFDGSTLFFVPRDILMDGNNALYG